MSNLPTSTRIDSSTKVKEFYNKYFTKKLAFPANEVDAVVGFFEKRGFEKVSATAVAGILLQQAKLDNIKTFELLDGIKNFNKVQLDAVVAEILNYNRENISSIGYRTTTGNRLEARNIGDQEFVEVVITDDTTTFMEPGFVEPGYVV